MARSRTDPSPSPDGRVLTLQERVEQAISGPGDTVVRRVVDAFIESEIKRRTDILTAGVNMMRQLEANLKEIKPDAPNVQNSALHYTPAKLKELAKNRQKMADLDTAMSAVLEKHDADSYNKLDQAIKKASGKGNGEFSG